MHQTTPTTLMEIFLIILVRTKLKFTRKFPDLERTKSNRPQDWVPHLVNLQDIILENLF
jgi:hypothetical protein